MCPDIVKLLQLTTEKAISDSIRNNQLDPAMRYMKALLKSSKELQLSESHLEGRVQEMHNRVGLALGELFGVFKSDEYLPLFGPAPWRLAISRSVLEVSISGILQGPDKVLHVIDFSPYRTNHGLRNDPILYLKAKTIAGVLKPWFPEVSKSKLHVFGLTEKDSILYHSIDSSSITRNGLEAIKRTIEAMEAKLDFPVLPCARQCPYKNKCSLETS